MSSADISGQTVHTRFAVPQIVTGARALLGLLLLYLASRGKSETAAVIWLFGLATDVLDGALARRLGVSSQFGTLFDYFADFVYHVLSPAVMSLQLLPDGIGLPSLILLSLPSPFAAARYARKAALKDTEFPGIPGGPGLATIVYGFYVVALVFLRREDVIGARVTSWFLLVGVPALSVLMVVRTRYPKLGAYPWILVPILIGLMSMPFFQTAILARVMMGMVVVYVIFAPLLMNQYPGRSGA